MPSNEAAASSASRSASDTTWRVGQVALGRVRAGTEPEIGQLPAPEWRMAGRGEQEMRDLVQDDIGFGVAVERRAVPVQARPGSGGCTLIPQARASASA